MKRRVMPYLACVLAAAQLLLMLVSWLLSAAFPASGIRSLLSSEGIRWFLGHFSDMMATPLMAWILLLAIGYGAFRQCGILSAGPSYREKRALMLSVLTLAVYACVLLLFTLLPHAVLRSAVGGLWPSPFSASLVPVVAFGMLLCSVVYGTVAGRFQSLSEVYDSLLYGIRIAAPWLLFYILLIQIYESLRFSFG